MLTYSAVITCDAPGCAAEFRRESIVYYGTSGAITDARLMGWRMKHGRVAYLWTCPDHASGQAGK